MDIGSNKRGETRRSACLSAIFGNPGHVFPLL